MFTKRLQPGKQAFDPVRSLRRELREHTSAVDSGVIKSEASLRLRSLPPRNVAGSFVGIVPPEVPALFPALVL